MQTVATFKIETDFPIPAKRGASPLRDAIRELMAGPVGASVFVPDGTTKEATLARYIQGMGGKGWATSRLADGGRRVWKIAEPKAR